MNGGGAVETGTGAYVLTEGEELKGGTYASINAAILALGGATLNLTGGKVTAIAEGSNGIFAYDGATINIADTVINVSGGNAGGILVADGGTYTTTGSSGAPAIYSTADITVKNATLTAQKSEAIVVEGLNSVTLESCSVTGNMTGMTGEASENIHNVMLYQSMSGDADVGQSRLTMTGGSLTAQSGDMFYVTNTDCEISLSGVTMALSKTGSLLLVAGNDG